MLTVSDEQQWRVEVELGGREDGLPLQQWKAQSRDQLVERFRRAGAADDPDSWARSEIDEDFAQFSRFVFLKCLWRLMLEMQDSCVQVVGDMPVGPAILEDQVEDLARRFAGPIGLFAHQILYLLSGDVEAFGHEPLDEEPLWMLMETIGGQPTGRVVAALYEDLWHTHPDGEPASTGVPERSPGGVREQSV